MTEKFEIGLTTDFLGADGKLTGYSGGDGIKSKEMLLRLEGHAAA